MMTTKTIKLAILAFIAGFLFLAQPAYSAAPGPEDAAGYVDSIIKKPYDKDDMAHKALAQLFGGFIFEPFGNAPTDEYPPTALAGVLGYTNVVALILGIIIMSYVIMAGALNTAASGEMLGRNWSSVWLPLRSSLAFGLIMPASGNAGETFSVAQSLVIYLIIIGSNSASWIWEKGVDLLLTGSPVMGKSIVYDSNEYRKYAEILHCAAVTDKVKTERDKGKAPLLVKVTKSTLGTDSMYTPAFTSYTYGDFKNNVGGLIDQKTKSINFDGCGSISIPSLSGILSGTAEENSIHNNSKRGNWEKGIRDAFATSAVSNLPAVINASIAYADFMVTNDLNATKVSEGVDNADNEVHQTINIASTYLTNVDNAFDTFINQVSNESLPTDIAKQWKSMATQGGWVGAGGWFFQASRLQGYIQTLVGGLNGLATPDIDSRLELCIFSACSKRNEMWKNLIQGDKEVAKFTDRQGASEFQSSSSGSRVDKVSLLKETGDGAVLREDITTSLSVMISRSFMNGLMWMGSDDAAGTGGNTGSVSSSSATGMISPFTAVSAMGRGLQQISVITWTAGLVAATAMGYGQSVWGMVGDAASFGTVSGVVAAGKYLLATVVPIMAGVSGLGFMLAFAIPFMPITVWIMLICGYLLLAIESIGAAPLAVIMLATPEGEGISGHNFQKALQMINAIILRPTLSIVGLFAAMTLAYVGFSIMNTLFWQVANMTSDGLSIFEILAIIFIYTTIAYKLCEYMVSIIYKIPDQIMEWMGGGLSRPFGEQAAEQDVTSRLGNNAAAGGMAIGAGGVTLGKIAEKKAALAEKRAKDASGNNDGDGGNTRN